VFVDRVKYEDILCNIETDSSNLVHGFLLTLYEGIIYFLPLSLAIMRILGQEETMTVASTQPKISHFSAVVITVFF
jgi:hypothetical protein